MSGRQVVHGGLIPAYVRESIRIAEEERPGPSLLELPEDVAREKVHLRPLRPHCCMSRRVHMPRPPETAWKTCMTWRLACPQVDADDAIVYHVDKVRRPIAEDKALNKAIAMLKASPWCSAAHCRHAL